MSPFVTSYPMPSLCRQSVSIYLFTTSQSPVTSGYNQIIQLTPTGGHVHNKLTLSCKTILCLQQKFRGPCIIGWRWTTLKTESCHDANFVITGGVVVSCNDYFQCHQWWQSWCQNNSIIQQRKVMILYVFLIKIAAPNIRALRLGSWYLCVHLTGCNLQ